MVLGWQSTVHPFVRKSAYRAIAALPFAERLEHLKDAAVRNAIITEAAPPPPGLGAVLTHGFGRMFRLEVDGRLDYEPRAEDSIAAEAERTGVSPEAIIYDMLMENDGLGYIYLPLLNYAEFNFDHIAEMAANNRRPCRCRTAAPIAADSRRQLPDLYARLPTGPGTASAASACRWRAW